MIKLLMLLLGGAKFGKVFLTVGTMLLSMAVYASIYGWQYAVGFVLLIFVHEMGHYIAARYRGLKVGAPTFIPFVGAWIDLKEQPRNVETEAFVAYAGPLLGSIAAFGCYYWGRYTGQNLFLALAYSGFFLNLFNLIPISPFDGGRITAILSPRIWLLGAPVLLGLFFMQPNPLLFMLALIAVPQVIRAWKGDHLQAQNRQYYQVSNTLKVQYGFYYLGLLIYLAIMCHRVHEMLGGR